MELAGYLFQLQAVQVGYDSFQVVPQHLYAVGHQFVGSEHRDASLVVDCHGCSLYINKVRHYQRKAKVADGKKRPPEGGL